MLSPYPYDVVDIHGDTVDADRIVLLHHLRDDDFGAYPIGGYGEAEPTAQVENIGKAADLELDGAKSRQGPSRLDLFRQKLQPQLFVLGVDPDRSIGCFGCR